MYMYLRLTLALAFAIVVAGCQTIGPGSIHRNRQDYGDAIADSWKQQALFNIVKLRYFDTPVFLDVSSVISSYTLQSQVDIAARIFPKSPPDTFGNLGASGLYTDRPTISDAPLTGEKFVNNLLRPIPHLKSQKNHASTFGLSNASFSTCSHWYLMPDPI